MKIKHGQKTDSIKLRTTLGYLGNISDHEQDWQPYKPDRFIM